MAYKDKQEHKKYWHDLCQKWRSEAIAVLGNKCVRCGYSDKRALQIDHIFGNGIAEWRNHSQIAYYKMVIQKGKSFYQLLCANCNWIKKHENSENPYKILGKPSNNLTGMAAS